MSSFHLTRVIERPGLPLTVVVEMPHTHSAVIEVFVRAGSAYESRDRNGISHFLEHVVLAATERYPNRTVLQRAIDATGGFLDAVTHKEMTEFSFQVLPERVGDALGLLGEALTRASFSEDAVESERQIVLEEMLTGNYEGAKDPFTEILWGTDSVGLPIIGSRDVVERLGPEELRRFHASYYTADNIVVCVAGQVDVAAVEGAMESFRGLGSSAGEAARPARARPQSAVRFHTERFASGSIDTCLMLRTPGWDSSSPRDHTVLYLLTQYFQNRVYRELIGPRLPVYYLYTGQETFVSEGYVYFYFNVSKDRFFHTLDQVVEEIDRLRRSGIGPDELEVDKQRYALSVVSNLDDPRDVAYRMGSDLLLCGPERSVSIEEELGHIRSVTADDLGGAAARLFRPENLCVVARGLGWWSERRLRKRLEGWLA